MKAIQRWFPLTPSTYARDIAKIFALSALVQSFFFLTAYYCVPGGALEFVAFGKALTSLLRGHLEFVPEAADRSVGFPFLLVLSGFYQNGSLIGITVIHGLMAMLMPILIYLTVVPISFVGAYYVGLASIISLGPFLFVKWLYHDQSYIFFSIVALWTFGRFVNTGKTSDLFWLTLAVTATSFVRPAGALLFPVLIVLAFTIVRGLLN